MELEELRARLKPFCEARYPSPVEIQEVITMPGHAGFAYGFRVACAGQVDSWFIRLPPPGVNWVGTADVLRQVAVLNALDGTDVPHCSVKWLMVGSSEHKFQAYHNSLVHKLLNVVELFQM